METIRKTLHHFFIPHHGNNHRARALHTDALIVYALVFTMFNLTLRIVHFAYPDILGYATNIHVQDLLAQTNAKRAEAGLSPLQLSDQLSAAAAGKASDMFANGYWAHVAPSGKTPWDFIVGAGYNYSLAGENLAKNFQDSAGVVAAWMASPTHRDNIVKAGYQEVGFAVVNGVLNGEETTLVVQMFGTQAGDRIAAAPEAPPETTPAPIAQAAPAQEAPVREPLPVETEVNTPIALARSDIGGQYIQSLPSSFVSAKTSPLINISTLTRDVTLVFTGVFVGVLLLDMWVVARKRIVRVTGHNIGHIAFLVGFMAALSSVLPGSIL